jgi:hypothetical protein
MNSRDAFRRTMQAANTERPAFVPIVYRLAARIEQTPLMDMVTDPTVYANALDGAWKLLQPDGIIIGFDPTLEAEFFGCPVDFPGDYALPVADWSAGDVAAACVDNSARLPVMLEATKRLVQTRGREVAIIGVISGPCSLAANIAGRAGPSEATISVAGSLLTQLTRAFGEVKVDAVIFREDLPGGSFFPDFLAHEKAAAAVYATLFNLTRFYNMAGLLMVREPRTEDLAPLVEKTGPGGLVLSGLDLDPAALSSLRDLSVSRKLAIGLPLPLADPDQAAARLNTCEEFIAKYRQGGFFYTSDGEVPPDIPLDRLLDITSRIKGTQVT